MIRKLDLDEMAVVNDVLELQRMSYKIEAELLGFDGIPPLMDSAESLKICDEIFYGYYIEDVIAGIISYKVVQNVLDIYRLAVHPDFFRQGVAGELIDFIEGLNNEVCKAIVSTGRENLPAVKFYLKKGYRKVRDMEVSPGIFVTAFEKRLPDYTNRLL